MSALTKFFRKLAVLFSRNRFASDLDEEMSFHREQLARDLEAGGLSPEDARYAALRHFGNATRLHERSHDVMGFRAETVAQDARFAIRQIRRYPGFAVTAILMLALGIGASTAIFAFVDAALIQPLPYAQPNRIVDVAEDSTALPRSDLSRADFEDWQRMNKSLSSLDAYVGSGFLLRVGNASVPVPGARVSDGFFRTLGVRPFLGRDFRPGEDQPGAAPVAILAYATWLQRFGGRRDVIGQTVSLSGQPYTLIGVLPADFTFQPRATAEIWAPLGDKVGCESRRGCHDLYGVGRLRDGVSVAAALADFQRIAAQLAAQYPGSNQGQGAAVQPLSKLIIGKTRPMLLTLLAGAGLLLLIACVNVASLLLVRSESRRREVAVRGALGATPARLVRQFVTEGLLLALAGCGAGLATAAGLIALIKALLPAIIAQGASFVGNAGINAHTAGFAAAVALLAAAILALTPVLRLAFRDVHAALSEGGRGSASRFWSRMGANLVVVELTIAVVLLAGAGLLGKSLYRLLHVELGFQPDHIATVQVMLPDKSYPKPENWLRLYPVVEAKVAALPGVQAVALTSDLPVQCDCDTDWIRIPGRPFHGEHNEVLERDVSPEYFSSVLQARLLRGRLFTDADDQQHPQVTVINQTLAKRYFPGEDPIGKMIGNGGLDAPSMRQVVGVVADVRENGLDDTPWPAEYFSIYHGPDNYFALAVRTAGDDTALLPELVRTVRSIDPTLGVFQEVTMDGQVAGSPAAVLHRFLTILVGGFAAMALILSVIGLYGVIAYSVSQRTREIGVRMALGAQRGAVHRLILKEAGWLVGIGIAAGLACSLLTGHWMESILFSVQSWDVPTLASVAALLGIAALVASYIPARRAARVNPVEALRAE
ncbi:MAG TPA: ABC transporter permease [Acidobacteriaceae bacterium]|jgi:predicted permease|nr:ABC transporter permease [Acidobacteriaceae bacterium]